MEIPTSAKEQEQFRIAPLFVLAFAGSALLVFAFTLVYAPWYVALSAFLAIALSAAILLWPPTGLYLIAFLVPVTAFSVSIVIKAPWNYEIFNTYADKIQMLAPLIPVTLAGLLVVKFARLQRISFSDPMLLPSILLLGYAFITLAWSDNTGHSVFELCRFAGNIIVFLLITALIRSEAEHRRLVGIWLAAMTIQCLIALFLFTYETVDYIRQVHPGIFFQFKVFGGTILATGAPSVAAGLQEFHETSLLTNMSAALTFGLLLTRDRRDRKFTLLLGLFLLFLLISMRTESRAGIGSMAVMLVALSCLLPKLKFRRIRTAIALIMCAFAIYALTHIWLTTMTQVDHTPRMVYVIEEILGGGKLIDTGHKQKESGRIYMYTKSFRALFSSNPAAGLGIGNLKYTVMLPHAHSLYFSLVLDFGLAGLVFIGVSGVIILLKLYHVIKLPDSSAKTMALAATAGLAGTCVHCLVDFEYNTLSLWFFLGLVMSSYSAALSASQSSVESVEKSERKFTTLVRRWRRGTEGIG